MTDEIEGPLQTATQKGVIPVSWDASKRQFVVSLRGATVRKSSNLRDGVNIYFRPPVLYDVRIRKEGCPDWGPGFLCPYSAASFIGLEPDTDYEVEVSSVDESGARLPNSTTKHNFRTSSTEC